LASPRNDNGESLNLGSILIKRIIWMNHSGKRSMAGKDRNPNTGK